MPQGREPLAGPLGEGLRQRREEAGMSLRGLAREVGVSASLISQIENGKATPSVGTLYAIVSELGISLDALFFDAPGGAAAAPVATRAADPGAVLRADDRLGLTLATGVRWERLTAARDPAVEFLRCTYPVGSESCPADQLMTHAGSEYGIVLSGRLGVTVGGRHHELDAGDSIAFDSPTPHRIWNLGADEPAIAIWTVVSRDGDPRVS
jgi:transcriptional regulator with XRE-family HTH domain